MTVDKNKYWAFVSCSHEDNREQRPDAPDGRYHRWGGWLQAALGAFSVPAEFVGQPNSRGEIIPERIQPVGCAPAESSGDADLSAEDRQALEQSLCLVVVCSPRSARSQRVNEAVRYFKQLGRGENIFPFVVAGEPHASEGILPGKSPAEECLVPALRHPVRADGTVDTTRRVGKYIFVDARHGVEKREVLANDHRQAEADLEMAKIQLVALLIGVGFNGLWWREQKRHFFDIADARRQAREALSQVEAVRRELHAARQEAHEAQSRILDAQNLPRDIHSQVQEAQNQTLAARNRAHEAEKQLQVFQNQVRDTQAQLEAARQRALVAESKVQELLNQAREAQDRLAETRRQSDEVHNAQGQLEEIRQQSREASHKLLEAQRQVQELQNQTGAAQNQLAAARDEVQKAQGLVQKAQAQAREAQAKVGEIQAKARNARRLNRVLALLAVLGALAASLATGLAWREKQVANQAQARAAAAEVGKFDLPLDLLNPEPLPSALQKIGGAEQAKNRCLSLDRLAAGIPREDLFETLKASSVIADDQQRSHFQKWLLIRLGWENPVSAMTCAGTIEGKIVNDAGATDSPGYFQLAVLDGWMQTDLAGAFNWVCQLTDDDFRRRAIEKTVRWAQSQPDFVANNRSLENCIEELAKTDARKALAVAESLPEGDWRSAVIISLFNDSPTEIMSPRKDPLPWPMFLPASYTGSTAMFPVEPKIISDTTNDPSQTQGGE